MGSRRSRRPNLEDRLEELTALLDSPDSETTEAALREGLANRHHVIVGKAAQIAGRLGAANLEQELIPLLVDPGLAARLATIDLR